MTLVRHQHFCFGHNLPSFPVEGGGGVGDGKLPSEHHHPFTNKSEPPRSKQTLGERRAHVDTKYQAEALRSCTSEDGGGSLSSIAASEWVDRQTHGECRGDAHFHEESLL